MIFGWTLHQDDMNMLSNHRDTVQHTQTFITEHFWLWFQDSALSSSPPLQTTLLLKFTQQCAAQSWKWILKKEASLHDFPKTNYHRDRWTTMWSLLHSLPIQFAVKAHRSSLTRIQQKHFFPDISVFLRPLFQANCDSEHLSRFGTEIVAVWHVPNILFSNLKVKRFSKWNKKWMEKLPLHTPSFMPKILQGGLLWILEQNQFAHLPIHILSLHSTATIMPGTSGSMCTTPNADIITANRLQVCWRNNLDDMDVLTVRSIWRILLLQLNID